MWRNDFRDKLQEKYPAGLLGKWTCTICSVGTLHKPVVCFNPTNRTGCMEIVCGSCIATMQFDAAMDNKNFACPFCRAEDTFHTYLFWKSKCDRKRNPQKYKYRNAIGRCFCTKCRMDREVTNRRFDLLKSTPFISTWFQQVMSSAIEHRHSVCAREWPRKTLIEHFNGVEIKN